jgi:ribosomal protein S27AE
MPDFINLTCPTCGGKLQITNDIERFACGYCGNEHIVKRSGGVVTIAPIVEGLKQVQRGTDKTAAELALQRLQNERSTLKKQIHEFLYAMFFPNANVSVSSTSSYANKLAEVAMKKFEEKIEEDTNYIETQLKNLEKHKTLNRKKIEQYTTLKILTSRLYEVRSQIDENKKIIEH